MCVSQLLFSDQETLTNCVALYLYIEMKFEYCVLVVYMDKWVWCVCFVVERASVLVKSILTISRCPMKKYVVN